MTASSQVVATIATKIVEGKEEVGLSEVEQLRSIAKLDQDVSKNKSSLGVVVISLRLDDSVN